MRYAITIVEDDYQKLYDQLFIGSAGEQAAYLLCRVARSAEATTLLVREVIPVEPADVLENSDHHMKISSRSFTRAMKRASDRNECFVFVHSHPEGYPKHSQQDDEEEEKLFRTAYIRIRTSGVHASVILAFSGIVAARVWLPDGAVAAIDRIRVIGRRFHFWFSEQIHTPIPPFFDRQVRAFGPDIQQLLARLRVGIVGVGGTGSAVAEQLIRLGVGACVVSDGERFESSNINRVYGSRVKDERTPKIDLTQRLAADIGLETRIEAFPKPITFQSVVNELKQCDVIFGCTDDEWGRSILTKLAIYYCVPVFDMGVKVDSSEGEIRSIHGRVTTLMPGTACLFCRERITGARIRAESIRALNPGEAAELEKEGYIPELEEPAPAIISFTTSVASGAVSEFLHRLTGFMGPDRESSEVMYLFDDSRVRTNRKSPREDCFCASKLNWARGDVTPLLDLTWRNE